MTSTTSEDHTSTADIVVTPIPRTGFIVDYEDAVQSYTEDYVSITIDNVTYDDSVLNTNEEGKYEVVIHNAGPLRMRNVSVRFRGLNGTLVKGGGAIAQFESEWVFNEMVEKIGPGKSNRIGTGDDYDRYQHLHFKAPAEPSSKQELLEVVIDGFDADFDPVHNRDNGGASGTWSKRVVAS